MIARSEVSTGRFIRMMSLRRRGVVAALFWAVLGGTGGMAQQGVSTTSEVVSTRRDLNGRDAVSEKVVTRRDRTRDEERVVIEPTYR